MGARCATESGCWKDGSRSSVSRFERPKETSGAIIVPIMAAGVAVAVAAIVEMLVPTPDQRCQRTQ